MKKVAHQAICMDLPDSLLAGLGECSQEAVPVFVVRKNGLGKI
jgi:hypothetical protein